MSSFSLEGVRAAVSSDVEAGLAALGQASQVLWDTLPAQHWHWQPDHVPPLFRKAGEACHKIHGTTGLVGLDTLYESACLLEELNARGQERAARAAEDLRLARELSRFCLDQIPRLRRLLELELAGQREESRSLQAELQAEGTVWLQRLGQPPRVPGPAPSETPAPCAEEGAAQAESHAGFSFGETAEGGVVITAEIAEPYGKLSSLTGGQEATTAAFRFEEPAPAPAPQEADGFSFAEPEMPSPAEEIGLPAQELLEVFCEETRGLCSELQALLQRLALCPTDFAALDGLERAYHTLKGSAAIVGLRQASAMAGKLQAELDTCCQRGEPVTRDELLQFVERTNEILEATGLTISLPPIEENMGTEQPQTRDARAGGTRPAEEEPEAVEPWQVPRELWETSQLEATEILDRLDRNVLALEGSEKPRDVLAAIFREYHTLKGVVNTVGLNQIGYAVHQFESLLEELRRVASLPPLHPLVALLVKVQNRLRTGLAEPEEAWAADWAELEPELRGLRFGYAQLAPAGEGGNERAGVTAVLPRLAASVPVYESMERLFVRVPTRRLDNLMNSVGELVIVRGRQGQRMASLRNLFRELDVCRRRFLTVVERFRSKHEFPRIAAGHNRLPPSETRNEEEGNGSSNAADRSLTTRFSDLELDRYDDVHILTRVLLEVGDDLSEVQSQVSGVMGSFDEDTDQFKALAAELRDEVTRSRMVPMETVFQRLQVPVLELAETEGKDVRFVVTGGRVGLDKPILDELYTPLLHLVRNAVTHGIERPEEREALGKPRAGLLRIEARQDASQLVLEIEDDGRGLDLPALLRIGRQRGLIPGDTTDADARVRELIFLPGVSTRAEADSIAGRGVGCDAVRVGIERLNGQIQVETKPGAGTLFRITLPLTLAISRALVVRQENQLYAIPLQFAVRIMDLENALLPQTAGEARIEVDGQSLTLSSLRFIFGLDGDKAPAMRKVVLLKAGDRLLPLAVEHIEGQEEVVVKSLGRILAGHSLFSGVTFNAEGRLVLILDVHGLLACAGQHPSVVRRAPPLETETPASRTRRVRVLYVDDSLSVRKVASQSLSALGVEVVLAADGLEALNRLRDGHFDLVFTDLEMPRLHGYELLREIRFSPTWRSLPVIVVTSRSAEKHRAQAREMGASAYLTKPFSKEKLQELLQQWAPPRK